MALPDTTTSGTPPPELTNAAHRVDFVLLATAESVAGARSRVHRALDAWCIPADSRDTAALVVSELVTNAVTHTNTRTVTCVLEATEYHVLLQVEDHGTGPSAPALQHADPQGERGRGLLLVEAVSQFWGATSPDSGAGGRVVWAILNTAPE
ncbi:ATP-binding protein [Streptomyces acidiscabies]|uniref:ATP-binding protein n=1 Tax=Streptomyces acidiscabies TaxID=42234 RepID=UPI00067B7CFD|nr:ATP-binding protein [Streptomyces acidiscabies]